MNRKFKKGVFFLQKDVTNLVEFEKPIESKLRDIIAWAENKDVELAFGTTEDNTYVCQYKVVAHTTTLCKGYVSELKAMLKNLFPKIYRIWEGSGDVLW